MWLFENPPTEYLQQTYGFAPDEAWYRRARLASLRMPGCSASFVSPQRAGAHQPPLCPEPRDRGRAGTARACSTTASRRPRSVRSAVVDGLYMDQLVAIDDVTDEMCGRRRRGPDRRRAPGGLRGQPRARPAARLLAARGITAPDPDADDFVVQVVALYNGGRYSAYTFRRYRDVRLVMAPERALGFFGGDPDNFTYPRYAADFAFFRIYGDDGQPLESPEYFPLSAQGVEDGSLVFVIGNPGSTSRGLTVAQLEFLRDAGLAGHVSGLSTARERALRAYLATGDDPDPDQLRGRIFGLSNARKAYNGRLARPRDDYILARRAAAERDFRTASPEAARADRPAGRDPGGEARATPPAYRAFPTLFNRGLRLGADAARARARHRRHRGAGRRRGAAGRAGARLPHGRDRRPPRATTSRPGRGLAGRPRRRAAPRTPPTRLLATSLAARPGADPPQAEYDPAVALVRGLLPRDPGVPVGLGRARRHARTRRRASWAGRATRRYGNAVPPDATFSLRFTDGVVSGYPYNGTLAPPMTTLFGLFDRYHSFCSSGASDPCEWDLPAALARRRGPPGPVDAGQLYVHLRHHRRQLGLGRGQPRRRAGGPQLRPHHRGAGPRLHLRARARPQRDGGHAPGGRGAASVYGLDGLVTEIRDGTLRQ